MAITPKSFIEFFEKEFGVEFVDAATGKKTLDIIAESKSKKACGFCRWGSAGEGKFAVDTYCVNDQSDYVTEYVAKDHGCNHWEAKDRV